MILSVVMMGLAEDNPACESVWQWQTFPVLGDIPGGTIDDICVGMDINFSPDWGEDSDGVCADNNECEVPVVSPLAVTYTWELYLGAQLMDFGEGQTINSTCAVAGYYYLLLEKTGVATGSECLWTHQKHFGLNFNVFEVDSLTPSSAGQLLFWDDQDGNPDTETYLVNHGPGVVTLTATSVPGVASESELPDCWNYSGGNAVGLGKLERNVSRVVPGLTVFSTTSGTSTKTTNIIVYRATLTLRADQGNRWAINVGHSWWDIFLTPDAKYVLYGADEVYVDEAGYWPDFEVGIYNMSGAGKVDLGAQSHPTTGYYQIDTTIDHILSAINFTKNLKSNPGTFHLLNHNCTHEARSFGNGIMYLNIPSWVDTPWELSDYLNGL